MVSENEKKMSRVRVYDIRKHKTVQPIAGMVQRIHVTIEYKKWKKFRLSDTGIAPVLNYEHAHVKHCINECFFIN